MNPLVSRCSYAGTTTDVEALLKERALTPPLKFYNNTDYATDPGDPDLTIPIGQTWTTNVSRSGRVMVARRDSIRLWLLERALTGELHDQMMFFWRNHFGVNITKPVEPHFCWSYHKLLAEEAMGNFKRLILKVSLNPAMMVFLDSEGNNADNPTTPEIETPNVNFARELQELYTMGRGNYTEKDIAEIARCFTGYWLDYNTGVATLEPKRHDFGTKTLSSFYGGVTIPGTGATEVNAVIDAIFTKQAQTVAKFICKKLYRYFINSQVDDALVTQMADTFIKGNWEIKPVLRLMMNSAQFKDPQVQGALIKNPVELVASIFRFFPQKFPTDVAVRYGVLNKLRLRLDPLMEIGDPPGVDGWKAYYQAPDYSKLWFTATTAKMRAEIIQDLFDPMKFTINGQGFVIDVIAATRPIPNAADPNALVSYVLDKLWPIPVPVADQARIKTSTLLNNMAEDRYWTNAWNAYLTLPDERNTAIVKERLVSLYKYVLLSQPFQLK